DLEDLPVDDLLLRLRHAVEVDLSRCPRGHLGVGRADVDDIGRARAAESFEHLADPPYARRVGLIDAGVGAVDVEHTGRQGDHARVVVVDGDVAGDHQLHGG